MAVTSMALLIHAARSRYPNPDRVARPRIATSARASDHVLLKMHAGLTRMWDHRCSAAPLVALVVLGICYLYIDIQEWACAPMICLILVSVCPLALRSTSYQVV